MLQHSEEPLGTARPMTAWKNWVNYVHCIQPVHPNPILSPLSSSAMSTSPVPLPSLMQSQTMERLWQQLALTQTLIDCLSRTILLHSTSTTSRITQKIFLTSSLIYPQWPSAPTTHHIKYPCISKALTRVLTSTTYMPLVLVPTKTPRPHQNTYHPVFTYDSLLVHSTIHHSVLQRSSKSTIAGPGLCYLKPGQKPQVLPSNNAQMQPTHYHQQSTISNLLTQVYSWVNYSSPLTETAVIFHQNSVGLPY